jgi:hypothetical protein
MRQVIERKMELRFLRVFQAGFMGAELPDLQARSAFCLNFDRRNSKDFRASAAHRGATVSIRQLPPPASEATGGGRCRNEVSASWQTRVATKGGKNENR